VRHDGDWRSLLQTLGSAALGVGLGLGVLVLGFVISRATLGESTTVSTSSASPRIAATATPRPSTPGPTLAPTPPPAPTPVPTPTKDPMVVTAFRGQGLSLAGLTVPAGYAITSPIVGKVRLEMYQYLDGQIRRDSNVADQPTFPYVFVESSDRQIKLRPGALDRDIQLLVKDGDTVVLGQTLFKTLTTGASSWQTFYDASVTAQVVASVAALPSGTEIDPVPVFRK
jgi:biotin carboxyl carrier protein